MTVSPENKVVGQGDRIDVEVTISAGAISKRQLPRRDVVFLVEHTTRMRVNAQGFTSGEDYGTMLKTLKRWISGNQSQESTEFALMVYDAGVEDKVGFEKPRNRLPILLNHLFLLEAGSFELPRAFGLEGWEGWENMHAAMVTAQESLIQRDTPLRAVVLISDGRILSSSIGLDEPQPAVDSTGQVWSILNEALPAAAQEGIVYFTYGFPSHRYTFSYGGDPAFDLLQSIADRTGGRYRRGNDSEELEKFLSMSLREMETCGTRELTLLEDLAGGVRYVPGTLRVTGGGDAAAGVMDRRFASAGRFALPLSPGSQGSASVAFEVEVVGCKSPDEWVRIHSPRGGVLVTHDCGGFFRDPLPRFEMECRNGAVGTR